MNKQKRKEKKKVQVDQFNDQLNKSKSKNFRHLMPIRPNYVICKMIQDAPRVKQVERISILQIFAKRQLLMSVSRYQLTEVAALCTLH